MAVADAVIAGIAARQYGVVALDQLGVHGVDRHAVRRRVADGRLKPLHRGVYATGQIPTPRLGTWLAAVLAMGPTAVLSHRHAACLRDLLSGAPSPINVIVPGAHRRRRPGIQPRRGALHPGDRSMHDRIPVTSVARTILDIAGDHGELVARRAYEQAERIGILDVGALRCVLERSNGHPGTGIVAGLLGYDSALLARAESELERLFFDLIRERGLPDPVPGALVCDYVVDAYWPEAHLVVELQGYEFHSNRETFERDHEKLATLKRQGVELLPLTHRQVTREADATVALLAQLVRTRSPAGAIAARDGSEAAHRGRRRNK